MLIVNKQTRIQKVKNPKVLFYRNLQILPPYTLLYVFFIYAIIKMKKVKVIKKQQQDNPQPEVFTYEGPVIPANKVSPQVIEILRTTKVPQLIIPSHTTITQAAQIYFKQYLKLFEENTKLNNDLIAIFEVRNSFAERYNLLKSDERQNQDNVRRKRRYANQIKRDFSCPWHNCNKGYGTEGSLTQHVKLKHEEYYKSGLYQMQLQKIIDEIASKRGHEHDSQIKQARDQEEESSQRSKKKRVKKDEGKEKKEVKVKKKEEEK